MANSRESISSYRIYYEDTDAGGVVYYANYLKFFERGRSDFLRERKLSQQELAQKEQIIFVVKNCQLEYKSPALLDDLITVKTIINEFGLVSFVFKQQILREQTVLTESVSKIVCIDKNSFKPKKVPYFLRDILTT